MLSNLIVENERCVGASEGRLGQLREIIRNGEHGRAHGARQGQATGCNVTSAGILDKAVGRGETCRSVLQPIFFGLPLHVHGATLCLRRYSSHLLAICPASPSASGCRRRLLRRLRRRLRAARVHVCVCVCDERRRSCARGRGGSVS
jgi:hypothetical protein